MSGRKEESLAKSTEEQNHEPVPPKYHEHSNIPEPGEDESGKYGTTQRGLKSRHIQLIALGGCIGTGLFVGSGSTLSLVGPAPLFMGTVFLPSPRARARTNTCSCSVGFLVISLIVWIVMQSLVEMVGFELPFEI